MTNIRPAKKQKVASLEKPRQAGLVLEEDLDNDFACNDEEKITVDSYIPTSPRLIRGPKRDEEKVTCRCKGSIQAMSD